MLFNPPEGFDSLNIRYGESGYLPHQHSIKYLGVQVDDRLTFTEHISTICNSVATKLKYFYSLGNCIRGYSTQMLKSIYLSVVVPTISFCASVWIDKIGLHLRKLNAAVKPFYVRIIRGWKTIAYQEACFLSRILPIEYLVCRSALNFLVTRDHSRAQRILARMGANELIAARVLGLSDPLATLGRNLQFAPKVKASGAEISPHDLLIQIASSDALLDTNTAVFCTHRGNMHLLSSRLWSKKDVSTVRMELRAVLDSLICLSEFSDYSSVLITIKTAKTVRLICEPGSRDPLVIEIREAISVLAVDVFLSIGKDLPFAMEQLYNDSLRTLEYKALIKRDFMHIFDGKCWKAYYNNYATKNKSRYSDRFFASPELVRILDCFSFMKTEYTQLLTGKGNFESYLSSIKVLPSAHCRKCLTERDLIVDGTPEHHLDDCPSGASHREAVKAQFPDFDYTLLNAANIPTWLPLMASLVPALRSARR